MIRRASIIATICILVAALGANASPTAAAYGTFYISTGTTGTGGRCSSPDFGTASFPSSDATATFQAAYDAIKRSGAIYVCAGTYNFLSDPLTYLDGRTISIIGAGSRRTHLDGQGQQRMFRIEGGGGPRGTFNLRDLHLTNGGGDDGWGAGAFYALHSDVNMVNVVFDENDSLGIGADGGAVYLSDGNFTVKSSRFARNVAESRGGSIFATSGNLSVESSTFDGNEAINDVGAPGSGVGGAIFTEYLDLTVARSTFSGNTANDHDGAIGTYFGSLAITRSSFFDNVAQGTFGGAIHTDGADVAIALSRFERNHSAANGGALDLCGGHAADGSFLRVVNSNFVGNTSVGAGGGLGIFCGDAVAEATIIGNRFVDNVAMYNGGGAAVQAINVVVHSNVFNRNTAFYYGGGGIVFFQLGAWTPEKLRQLSGNRYLRNAAPGILACGGGVLIQNGIADDALLLRRGSTYVENRAWVSGTEEVCAASF